MHSIAFVTPSMRFGGRERVLSILANYFAEEKGIDVHLIIYGKHRELNFNISPKVHIHKPEWEFNDKRKTISTLKTLLYLRRTVRASDADIMVSFEEIWNRFALLATVGMKIRKVISNRNSPLRTYGKFDAFLAKILYPQADLLIAQSQIAKSIYEKKYKLKKCVVIGNPIKKLDEDLLISAERQNIIVTVGRLMNSKNHDRLVRIFARVRHDNWRLCVVGGDFANHNNMEKLKRLCIELGVSDSVVFTGAQSDVNKFLLRSKIFVFASEKEGFPNVIGEALAAGLPVISYDCIAGPSEMIEDGKNGYLIPLYDDNLFKERLEYLMECEDVRSKMSDEALASIDKFGDKKICEQFYNNIIK